MSKYTTNQDVRQYMVDNSVSQKELAEHIGISQWKICKMLQVEMTEREKETVLNHIDVIVAGRYGFEETTKKDGQAKVEEASNGNSTGEKDTKFRIGDRVKIPSKSLIIGTVSDIWQSFAKRAIVYSVNTEDGRCSLYDESQLEPAPLPIDYRFEACIDGNVAVVAMVATQGNKTWIHARGHAHILHDGDVGLAHAISFASKRMFKELDIKQENPIYFKNREGDE